MVVRCYGLNVGYTRIASWTQTLLEKVLRAEEPVDLVFIQGWNRFGCGFYTRGEGETLRRYRC
jgi:hypothetical protein